MPDERSVEAALKEMEDVMIEVIQATKDHDMLDHLTKALAEIRKARIVLEA